VPAPQVQAAGADWPTGQGNLRYVFYMWLYS